MNLSLGLQHKVFSLFRSLLGQVILSVARDGQLGPANFQGPTGNYYDAKSHPEAMGAHSDSGTDTRAGARAGTQRVVASVRSVKSAHMDCTSRHDSASHALRSHPGSQRHGLRTSRVSAPNPPLGGDIRAPQSPSTISMRCHQPSVPLRVLHEIDRARPNAVGRMVISGRMADVCAELDRLAAMEAALQTRMQVMLAG